MHTMLLLAVLLTSADEPITEIKLERTPCYGTCPIDVVTLRSDGTAEYAGERFVKNLGKHEGKVNKADFDKLAKLVAEEKFFEFKDRYTAPITDLPTYITTVKRGKETKQVSNYADAAPRGLAEIEKAVVDLMEKIEWAKAK